MLLCLLAEREQSAIEPNARLDLSQSALSQHLALLREDGLARTRRDGHSLHYSLAPDRCDACSAPCTASSAATP